MDRRRFLKILAGAVPGAAVAPTYFFAPRGGWRPQLLTTPWISVDYGTRLPSYSTYWITRDGRILAFDGIEVQPMSTEWRTFA